MFGGVSIGSLVGYLILEDKLTPALQAATNRLNVAERKFTSVGQAMSLGITLPMAAAGVAVTKFAATFEKNVTRVSTLSGVAEKNVEKFRNQMLKLGPETAQGPNALAEGLLVVTSTGIRGAEAMDILTKSAQGASLGMGETKDIARALTAVMTAYGKENINAAKAMDQMFQTVVEGGAEASELATTLGSVVGTAAQVGVQFDEVGAFLATYTRLGVTSARATVALQGVLSTLLSPTLDARDALASIGITADDLRKKVKEQGLTQALLDLQTAFGGNVSKMDALFGNVRALSGVLGNVGSQAQAYRDAIANIGSAHGNFDKAVEKTKKTLDWNWNAVKALAESTAIAVGNSLAPAMGALLGGAQKLLPVLTGLANAFAALPGSVQSTVGIFLALTAAIGPLLWGVGKLIGLWGDLLGPVSRLLNSIPVLTFRIWALDTAQKVAAISTAAMSAAQTTLGGSSLVMGSRMAMATAAAKAQAVATGVMSSAMSVLAPYILAAGINLKVFATWMNASAIATAAGAAASKIAVGAQVALGAALLAVKWVLLPLAVAWASFKAALWGLDKTGASEYIEHFSLRLQRFLGLIDKHATNQDLWNSVQANTARRSEEAARATEDQANAVKNLSDELSGKNVAKQVELLATAVKSLNAEQLKSPEVLSRLKAQLEPLLAAGAQLTPQLQGIAKALGLIKTQTAGNQLLSYSQQLDRAKAAMSSWGPDIKKQIAAGRELGQQAGDIADEINRMFPKANATKQSVEIFLEGLQKTTTAAKQAANPLKELTNKVAELGKEYEQFKNLPGAGGEMLRDWVDENSEALIKAERNATAFGLAMSDGFKEAVNQAKALKAGTDFAAAMEEQRRQTVETAEAIKQQRTEIQDDINRKVTESFNIERDLRQKLSDFGKSDTELRISNVKREWDAEIRALNGELHLTKESYDKRKAAIDAYYEHLTRVANGTQDTIVERMRAAGVATRQDLLDTASSALRDYNQMKQSGEFTAEALSKAFQDANVKIAASFGITADSLNSLAGFFQQLGQVAQGTLGSILGKLGQTVTMLAKAKEESIKWGSTTTDASGKVTGFQPGKWGIASALFSSKSTTSEKVSAGIASAGAVAQGALDIWQQTGAHKTALGNAGAGALAGMQAGAAFGPWGMAIGAAAGFITGLIRGKPKWAKIQEGMAKDFGLAISDETAKAIEKVSKEKFKGDTSSGMQYMLGDAIKEAGGVTTQNYDKLLSKVRDTFSFLGRGQFDKEQANKVLSDTFEQFQAIAEEKAKKTGGVFDKAFREFFTLNKQYGTENEKITALAKAQTQSSIESLNNYFSLLTNMKQGAIDAEDEVASLKEQLGDIEEQRAELQKKSKRSAAEERQLERLNEKWTELSKKIKETEKASTDYDLVAKAMAVTSEKAANGLAAMIEAQYNALIQGGATVREAVDAIAPSVDELGKQLEAAGIKGSSVFDALKEKVALAKDTFAGPMFDAIGALTGSMTGLFNTGSLTADMFMGVTTQVGQLWTKMKEQGKATPAAMAMIQPQLQAMWQVWKETGWAVDEVTQKMLEDAEAAGIVGEKHKTLDQQMLDSTNRIATAVEGLAKAFGVDLPDQAAKGAKGIQDALNGVKTDYTVTFDYQTSGMPPGGYDSGWRPGGDPNIPAPSGATTYHQGGVVADRIRRAHSGLFVNSLGAGEVPIIAKQGEGILSNNVGMPTAAKWALDMMNSGETPEKAGNNAALAAAIVQGLREANMSGGTNIYATLTQKEQEAREILEDLTEVLRKRGKILTDFQVAAEIK